MYTPSQVSAMLHIPPSTLRRLASELEDMLTPRQARHRRYNESDISLLERAREMTGKGMSVNEARQALMVVSETPAIEQEKGDTLALVPTIANELERIDSAYRQVMSELEKIRLASDRDKARLEALERWAAQPWYKRLLYSPPK